MNHYPVDNQSRGRLRLFKAELTRRYYDQFDPLMKGDALVNDASGVGCKTSVVGRERAFKRLQARLGPLAALEGVRLTGKWPMAVWSILKPRNHVMLDTDNPALEQDGICVNYLLAGRHPDKVTATSEGLWTLEVFDHALGRMLQRDRQADPEAVIRQAHKAALRLKSSDVKQEGWFVPSFLLPAGQGAFIATFIVANETTKQEIGIHIQCHTWLHADQLHEGQTPLIDDGEPGDRLGDHALLPAPLRKIDRHEDRPGFGVAKWVPGLPSGRA